MMSDETIFLFSAITWLFISTFIFGVGWAITETRIYLRLRGHDRLPSKNTMPEVLVAGSLFGLVVIGLFGQAVMSS